MKVAIKLGQGENLTREAKKCHLKLNEVKQNGQFHVGKKKTLQLLSGRL